MITEIPIRTNFYNFSFNTTLLGRQYWMRFDWQKRQAFFVVQIGYSPDSILVSGMPALIGVQLNKTIVAFLPGSLFFYSDNPRIDAPNPKQLGESVKLLHYIDDTES